jgi:hypothetical protein
MVQLCDTLDAATNARICADGSLVAEVYAARTGLQDYAGREVDPQNERGLRDKAVVKVYRPESEVFREASLATFAAAPVTIDHPSVPVDAANWRELGRGEINGDVVRDGARVRVPIIVRDAAAVKAATTTHKQLSMGYATNLVFPADGKHPDGTACDAYQTDIKINHIAWVRAARGGPEMRVVDERSPQEKPKMKIRIGDAEVDATNGEAVRIAVDAAMSAKDAEVGALTAKLATATTALEAKDGEIVGLKAKLVDAEITPEKLQALADARAQVIGKAKSLAPALVVDGKTDAEIRKAAVTAKLGDAATAMSDAAIEGAFAALTVDAKPEQPRITPIPQPQVIGDAAARETAAFAKANDFNAWRTAGQA